MLLVLGAVDGSLITLIIADPQYSDSVELLTKLPSRQIVAQESGNRPKDDGAIRALLVGRLLKKRNARTPHEESL
jgi:hypothetical protein